MGKRFNYLKSILILLTLTNFVSCSYFDNEIEVANPSDFAYSKLYLEWWEFAYSATETSIGDYFEPEFEIIFSHADMRGDKVLYVDARRADGYSTWSSPQFAFKYDPGSSSAELDKQHPHYYKAHITMSSPPAHLHLCLNALGEDYYGITKKWKVASVTDESGKSLADDPDWGNYTDNIMVFRKADKFVYSPGAKRSKTELDLFGTEKENPTLYGNYSVKEDASSKKVTLTLSFPKLPQPFEVVESSWTSLTLKGTIAGKTGLAKFVPVN